jgi:lysophospholipase L1-like esterase
MKNYSTCSALLFFILPLAFAEDAMNRNVHFRGSLENSRIQFEKNKKGHVAFIGGSITEMNGYRPMVSDDLKKRFPNTEFTFTSAGISSTCSTSGAFRLEEHVLKMGSVDLFFIEYAVNDDQDAGHARRECIRGMEGILSRARKHNPNMDIVITHFVNPGMLEQLQSGKEPLSMESHETVARHYGVPTIHLAQEVADQIKAGTMTWKKFGGTHPRPPGNRLCADLIQEMFESAWKVELASDVALKPHPMPEKAIDPGHYGNGRFIDIESAEVKNAWTVSVPDWNKLKGGKRGRFTKIPILWAEEPDAELTLEFEGKAVGAFILAGPDAGIVESSVDGGPAEQHQLFHRFSRGLHYPRTVMFETDLEPGKHVLKLRMTEEKHPKGIGHAMRIMQFVAN